MVLSPLHLPTLLVVTAVVIAFSGATLMLARGRDQSAIAVWGVAMILGAAGIVMLLLGSVQGVVLQEAGSAVILLGSALSWAGARIFTGRRVHVAAVLLGPLLAFAWDIIQPQNAGLSRFGLGLYLGAIYTAGAAAELWRGRHERLRSRNPAAVLLALHAGVYLWRAILLTIDPAYPETFRAGVITFLVFETLLHTVAMAFLLHALAKERAELRAIVQLQALAMLDGLTGLGNRRQFDQALDQEVQRAVRDHVPIALLMIDADHFKAYNDTYGHQSGDDCLRAIAAAIRSAVQRPGDTAARYGGEEFAVLLAQTDEVGAVAVAAAVHDRIAAMQIDHAASGHGRVSVSIGVAALLPTHLPHRADRLVQAADAALYAAKAAGRNRTSLAAVAGDSAATRPGSRHPLAGIVRRTAPATSP